MSRVGWESDKHSPTSQAPSGGAAEAVGVAVERDMAEPDQRGERGGGGHCAAGAQRVEHGGGLAHRVARPGGLALAGVGQQRFSLLGLDGGVDRGDPFKIER